MDRRNHHGDYFWRNVCLGILMRTPYDTGKVKIGLYYEPPKYVEQDSDMIAIQGWFLGVNKAAQREKLANIAYCWIVAIAIVLAIIYS